MTATHTPASILATQEEFAEELRRAFTRILKSMGFVIPSGLDFRKTCITFFGILHRMIPAMPRPVRWSSELRTRGLTPHHQLALRTIEAESLGGQSLNHRLTRKFWDAAFDDGLLNDWGIQHLHLGAPGSGPKGLSGGMKDLLFVLVRPDVLYFIDVRDHHAFAEHALVEIIHANWPDVLAPYRMRANLRLGGSPTPQERRDARKGGLTMFTQMADGTIYGPPGGGQATSRVNVAVVERASDFRNTVANFHAWCSEHLQELIDHFVAQTSTRPIKFGLHIESEDGLPCLFLKETRSNRLVAEFAPRNGRG